MKTRKLITLVLVVAMVVSCAAIFNVTTYAATEGLNAKAWSFAGGQDSYNELFGGDDGIKAGVAAGTGLTARDDCAEIVSVNDILGGDSYVIQYTGVMVAETSGWYQYAVLTVDNNYVAYVGGVKVFDFSGWSRWEDGDDITYGKVFYLEAGEKYSYEAYFIEQDGGEGLDVQVVKDGVITSFADAGIKFYADETASSAAPAVDETILFTFAGAHGVNGESVANGDRKISETTTGLVWNYTTGGYTKDSVIKVAWFITVDSVSDDVDPDESYITYSNNFNMEANGGLEIPNSVFTDNVGKNIIVVGVFNQPNDWMEGRWDVRTPGIAFTIHKVVIGTEKADFKSAFAAAGGYSLAFEEANEDDIEFTASGSTSSGSQGETQKPSDDKPSNDKPSGGNSQTGDVASVAAILVAGVAGFGGLKLRKKSK